MFIRIKRYLFKKSLKIQYETRIIEAGNRKNYELAQHLISIVINVLIEKCLTNRQKAVFDTILERNTKTVTDGLSNAFDRGWGRDEDSNMRRAMEEVLRQAERLIEEFENRRTGTARK